MVDAVDPVDRANSKAKEAAKLLDLGLKVDLPIPELKEAAEKFVEAAELTRAFVHKDDSHAAHSEVIREYWLAQAEKSLFAFYYRLHDIEQARNIAEKELERFDSVLNKSAAEKLTGENKAHIDRMVPSWTLERFGAEASLLAVEARRAWNDKQFIEALDLYTALEEVYEDAVQFSLALPPMYQRIARGNHAGALVNKSQAILGWLREGDVSGLVLTRCVSELFLAFFHSVQASEANAEWPEYTKNAERLRLLLLGLARLHPESWSDVGTLHASDPTKITYYNLLDRQAAVISSTAEPQARPPRARVLLAGVSNGDAAKKMLDSFQNIELNGDEHVEFDITSSDVDRPGRLISKVIEITGESVIELCSDDHCLWERFPEIETPEWPDLEPVTTQWIRQTKAQYKLLLLTVTEVEARNVLSFMEPGPLGKIWQGEIDGRMYYGGTFGGYPVVLARCRMGNLGRSGSTLVTSDAISTFKLKAIIMIGIAYGMKRTVARLGDVLVAEAVQYSDHQKVKADGQVEDRSYAYLASELLTTAFRDRVNTWKCERSKTRVKVHEPGLVLSADKLVDNLDFKKDLMVRFPRAIGGEMEGAGAFSAAHSKKVDIILVKSICDWGDGDKDDLAQAFAAHTASSVCHHVLNQVDALRGVGIKKSS